MGVIEAQAILAAAAEPFCPLVNAARAAGTGAMVLVMMEVNGSVIVHYETSITLDARLVKVMRDIASTIEMGLARPAGSA